MTKEAIQQLAEQTLIKHGRADSEKRVAKGEIISYEPIPIEELRKQENFRFHVAYGVEMFEAGAAAAAPQTGWVKASERKPKEEGLYFVRKSIYGGLGYTKYTARFEEEDFYDDHYNDRSLPFYVEGLEWLEEAQAPQAIPEKEEGELSEEIHTVIKKFIRNGDIELRPTNSFAVHDLCKEIAALAEEHAFIEKHLYQIKKLQDALASGASLRGKEEGERGASDNKSNGTAVASHTASSGNSIKQYLKQRIKELNEADAKFCHDRWDNPAADSFLKMLSREESNKVTFARQELETVLKMLNQ